MTIFLHRINGFIIKYDMIVLFSRNLSGFWTFFRIFLKYWVFNGFDHISSQNWWFTSQKRCDNFLIWIFIRFPDFPRIFPNITDFSEILRFQCFWPYFFTELTVYFSNMICLFSYLEFYPVSGFSEFSGFSGFFRIFLIFFKFLQISLFEIKGYSAHEVEL